MKSLTVWTDRPTDRTFIGNASMFDFKNQVTPVYFETTIIGSIQTNTLELHFDPKFESANRELHLEAVLNANGLIERANLRID